jgi:gliding motility-associated-like protein
LEVKVKVSNGRTTSKKFDLRIAVTPKPDLPPSNVAPVITAQRPLSVNSGSSINITFADLTVTDPDDNYPDGFTMALSPGNNYTVDGHRVTPSSGFSGTLSVPVRVNDGKDRSPVFNLVITVNAATPVNPNAVPQIIGQRPLTTGKGEAIIVSLTDLVVTDANDEYPAGFTLKILPGAHYTFTGMKVIPEAAFTGLLQVSVRVNDGKDDSAPFNLKIEVADRKTNQQPVITGQAGLNTLANTALTIRLTHLIVTDPDNDFPNDFKLSVLDGNNYTVSGTTITPTRDFIGTLAVPVTVNDGELTSAPFNLLVKVVENGRLQITGHKPLATPEDSVLVITLSDLHVIDPEDKFPGGFSLRIGPGANYQVNEQTIRPVRDFYGNLRVPVTVTNGRATAADFELLIVVTPVNDAPVIIWDDKLLPFTGADQPVEIAREAQVKDVDDRELLMMEVGFQKEHFQTGSDEIQFAIVEQLEAVYNGETGVLSYVGSASLATYDKAIQSLKYNFKSMAGDTLPSVDTKVIYFRLSDGKTLSEIFTREIQMLENVELDIPTGFTPNNDNANDTWSIRVRSASDSHKDAVVRVFTKHGVMVYEAVGFEKPWDGRLGGEMLPADSYFYTIEMQTAFRKVNYKGVVTLLR